MMQTLLRLLVKDLFFWKIKIPANAIKNAVFISSTTDILPDQYCSQAFLSSLLLPILG
jgi:hypothetical protein